jgi:hypothetical protein
MAAKITLTLEHIDPKHPNSAAMAATIGLLAQLVDLPAGGLKLSIVCEEEDMESYASDIYAVLSKRPVGIKVKVKKESEDEIERMTLATVTPMDKAGWN